MSDKEFVQSLENGLAVLQCFSPENRKINIATVSRITGLSRAAARRYLFTLEKLGYLENRDKYYFITAKVLILSGTYYSTAILPKIAQPILNNLTENLDLAFSLSILDRYEVTNICRSSNYNYFLHRNPYGMHLGNRLPSHATSSGKLLLSFEEHKVVNQLFLNKNIIKLTPHTLTDLEEIIVELKRIRKQEWCYSSQEHELGIHALAVPVYNYDNKVIAALNIVSPLNETTKDYLINDILPKLLAAAYEIRKLIC